MDWRRDDELGRCVTGEVVAMTTRTPASPVQSLKLGVAGQPRASPVRVPAYLHGTTRPGATPNTKVLESHRTWTWVGSIHGLAPDYKF